MRKTGKTPLLRAKQFEKALGVGKIYLKLEGTNPKGHLIDRLAEMAIIETKHLGAEKVVVLGKQRFTRIVAHYADYHGVTPVIPVFKSEKWKRAHLSFPNYLDYSTYSLKEAENCLSPLLASDKAHLIRAEYNTAFIREVVSEELAEECLKKVEQPLASFFVQENLALSESTVSRALYKMWIEGRFKVRPQVISGIKSKHNMCAISDNTVMVEEGALKAAVKLLKQTEGIRLSEGQSYALGAFYQMAKAGKLNGDAHLIVLNDGKTEVQIDNIGDFDEVSKKALIDYTRQWLAQYADSTAETEDAIEHANRDGFILLAKRDERYEGVCIVVHTGFENFIPSYHLAYIGTHASTKGRGVGTALIEKAIEVTDGNLSLHVDLDNKGAKKLYEKMGFRHTYNRMLYKG